MRELSVGRLYDDRLDARARLSWAKLAITTDGQRDAPSGFTPAGALADGVGVRAYVIREFGPRRAGRMTHGIDAAGLQIHSVEERTFDTAVCVVRCVGGIVRVGQEFTGFLTLDRILRYEKEVDFVDPPHSAKVHLSGTAVSVLDRGVVITAARTGK